MCGENNVNGFDEIDDSINLLQFFLLIWLESKIISVIRGFTYNRICRGFLLFLRIIFPTFRLLF